MKKKRLMFAYHDFIKAGKFGSAWMVLCLLNRGQVCLGLDNDSWEIEKLAQRLNLRVSYGWTCYSARVFLR